MKISQIGGAMKCAVDQREEALGELLLQGRKVLRAEYQRVFNSHVNPATIRVADGEMIRQILRREFGAAYW